MADIPERVTIRKTTDQGDGRVYLPITQADLRVIGVESEDAVKVATWEDRVEIHPVENNNE